MPQREGTQFDLYSTCSGWSQVGFIGTRIGLTGTRVGLTGTRVGLTGTRVGLTGTRVGSLRHSDTNMLLSGRHSLALGAGPNAKPQRE